MCLDGRRLYTACAAFTRAAMSASGIWRISPSPMSYTIPWIEPTHLPLRPFVHLLRRTPASPIDTTHLPSGRCLVRGSPFLATACWMTELACRFTQPQGAGTNHFKFRAWGMCQSNVRMLQNLCGGQNDKGSSERKNK